ncbi:MAG: ferrous iron transport protein B [Deltaproteobacteria bacterium]|jgi:ferrous iron transport protein B|nr:ferrous iron transport protein B [Deltaproteobacteria bacterium]
MTSFDKTEEHTPAGQEHGKGALPAADRPLTIALAGNPNSGKSTVFNHYTGSRQHVANYPGITVDRKEGLLKAGGEKVRLIDLPGTYALTAYSQDELVARLGLTREAPDCVIDVINSGAMERNLYLAVQIMELGRPLALILNMYDEVEKQGIEINSERLSGLLDLPVYPAVARAGQGLKAALEGSVKLARDARDAGNQPKPLFISYGPDLDPVLEEMAKLVEESGIFAGQYPSRWVAIKLMERDSEVIAAVRKANPGLADALRGKYDAVARHLRATAGSYPEALIADYRYGFISSLLRQGVIARKEETLGRMAASDRVDKVLTHRLLGPLIMLGVLYLMYKITFGLGGIPMGWVEDFFGWMNESVSAVMEDGLAKSMIVSGIIDGVGAVMSFVPLILVMFLLISVLEDSGYMARVAYMLDRIFRAFGLHGYSVMPFIVSGGIAGGCAVPGVMACRTLRSPRERLATILTLPFMTCGAKLPVFLLLAAAFFPDNETKVMMIVSLAAWASALLVARLLRSTLIRGEATPFVMELPPYRIPTLFGIIFHALERVWQYIKKAGTVILAISILIWAGMSFPELPEDLSAPYAERIAAYEEQSAAAGEAGAGEEALAAIGEAKTEVENQLAELALENSYAGRIGKALEPVSASVGFDWRVNIALVGGLGAKEVIVSTLGTAYSLGAVDPEEAGSLSTRIAHDAKWNPAVAAALMIFVLLYSPCFVTLVVMKQEAGSWKWVAFSLAFDTMLAFVAAVGVYQAGSLILSS